MNTDGQGLPRVLIIGAPPVTGHGSGVTITNLFHSLPAEHVAQVHLDAGTVDARRVSHALRLPSNGSRVEGLARRLVTARNRGGASTETPRIAAAPLDARSGIRRRARRGLGAALDLLPITMSQEALKWITDFRPDVIYSQLGSVRVCRLVNHVAMQLDIPVVPHFMDAWPTTLYSRGELLGSGGRALASVLRETARRSPRILVISPEMAKEYGDRLGRPTDVFLNCVEDHQFADASAGPDTGPLVLRYVGGLHLDRWRSLAEVAAALERVAPTARLHVHAPDPELQSHSKTLGKQTNVILGPSLDPQEVPLALRDSHILVHVESFHATARAYTRLSISTKLPQYMASGRAILGYGPPEVSSMRHLDRSGAGLVVSKDIESALKRLSSAQVRLRHAGRGRDFAAHHHRQAHVAASFLNTLRHAADLGSP